MWQNGIGFPRQIFTNDIYIYIYDYQMKNTQKNVLPSFGCVMIAI